MRKNQNLFFTDIRPVSIKQSPDLDQANFAYIENEAEFFKELDKLQIPYRKTAFSKVWQYDWEEDGWTQEIDPIVEVSIYNSAIQVIKMQEEKDNKKKVKNGNNGNTIMKIVENLTSISEINDFCKKFNLSNELMVKMIEELLTQN
jgi:hypothetical protein